VREEDALATPCLSLLQNKVLEVGYSHGHVGQELVVDHFLDELHLRIGVESLELRLLTLRHVILPGLSRTLYLGLALGPVDVFRRGIHIGRAFGEARVNVIFVVVLPACFSPVGRPVHGRIRLCIRPNGLCIIVRRWSPHRSICRVAGKRAGKSRDLLVGHFDWIISILERSWLEPLAHGNLIMLEVFCIFEPDLAVGVGVHLSDAQVQFHVTAFA